MDLDYKKLALEKKEAILADLNIRRFNKYI